MISIFLMDKKIYKESKELLSFRIVWEKEQYIKRWRKMRLLRIKNKKEQYIGKH